jgi:hypothetical protein
MSAPPATRYLYHIRIPAAPDNAEALPVVLEAVDVIAWVKGFAAAHGHHNALGKMDQTAPEDTRRVQALQIADELGLLEYVWPESVPTEG